MSKNLGDDWWKIIEEILYLVFNVVVENVHFLEVDITNCWNKFSCSVKSSKRHF